MALGFTDLAGVCATTHEAVLSAIVSKLRAEIAELGTESTCFLSDAPFPGVEIHENLFCTVAPADDSFEVIPLIGAGNHGVIEAAVVQVTVWSRMLLDRLDHSARSLTDNSRGLLRFKHRILQSLAGSQIYADAPVNLIPLLIEPLSPTRALHPNARRGHDDYSTLSLVFSARFYWSLS